MANAVETSRTARGLAGMALLSSLALCIASAPWPARAQETPDQYDAANAENRRHADAENQLHNQAHDLRDDRAKALLQCQGAGSAGARTACGNNVETDMRRRGLDLNNQVIRENDSHNLILKGIGVHRVP